MTVPATLVTIMYAGELPTISVVLPVGYKSCSLDDTDPIDLDVPKLELQPFALFFLIFYIVLTTVQCLTVFWHRLSTFYHFIDE